ncbi:MAG: cell division protein SepF [Actinomycetes bacterium]
MAGAMRKMGVYLGLVEDDQYDYDDYDEYDERQPARHDRDVEQTRALRPVRDHEVAPDTHSGSHRGSHGEPTGATHAEHVPGGSMSAPHSQDYRITTLHPRTYNDARAIGEAFRENTPVIMNLTEMDDTDAKRIVDFSAGLVFGRHGTIERVTQKVFLLSPANVVVTAEQKQRLAEGGFFNQS